MILPNKRRMSFLRKHPRALLDLLRTDRTVRVATSAATFGLEDLRKADLLEFAAQAPSLDLVERAIATANSHAPYHDSAFLYYVIRAIRPKIVIETGVWYGYSSTFILQALCEDGQGTLCSIDLKDENFPRGLHEGFVVPKELRSRWNLLLGRSEEKLPEALEKYPEVDLFVHDSDHSYDNMMYEFRAVWPKLRPGGMLVADNVELNDSFDDFCSSVGVKGTKASSISTTHGVLIKPQSTHDTRPAQIREILNHSTQ
jgi:predicted O-methyltransferase YrrM